MPTISRLLTDEFYLLYDDTAFILAEHFGLTWEVDYECLVAAYARWLGEMKMYLGASDSPYDEQWTHALSILAIDLCASDCIRYKSARAVAGSARINQLLLLQYPSIYTGLQFCRTQHMELQRKNSSVVMAEKMMPLTHEGLPEVLRAIRQDPRVAANFVNLLRLPK